MKIKYENVEELVNVLEEVSRTSSNEEIEQIIKGDDIKPLRYLPRALVYCREDQDYVEKICIMLSSNDDEFVRGNSILAFGYISEVYKKFINGTIYSIVENAILYDSSDYVRGQANTAADDIEDFLGWKFKRKD